MPRAAGLADEIRDEFGVEATLEKGDSGIFDVKRDGELVFSKHELERFPESGEIVRLLR